MVAVTITQITYQELQVLIIDCVNAVFDARLSELTSKPQNSPDQWFDLNELCDYHPQKPAKATVYGWTQHQKIPHHKRGKKLYFLKSEIDNWLKHDRLPIAEYE